MWKHSICTVTLTHPLGWNCSLLRSRRKFKRLRKEVIRNVEDSRAWKLLFHVDRFCPYKVRNDQKQQYRTIPLVLEFRSLFFIRVIRAKFSFNLSPNIVSICFNALKQSCILVQGFCPLRIKITQFPGGFVLNYIYDKMLLHLGPYISGHLLHLGPLYMPRLDRNSILCKDGSFSRHYEIKYHMMR